ncbi:hypothetical protein LguiB_016098 [Lonicera macranthoides]
MGALITTIDDDRLRDFQSKGTKLCLFSYRKSLTISNSFHRREAINISMIPANYHWQINRDHTIHREHKKLPMYIDKGYKFSKRQIFESYAIENSDIAKPLGSYDKNLLFLRMTELSILKNCQPTFNIVKIWFLPPSLKDHEEQKIYGIFIRKKGSDPSDYREERSGREPQRVLEQMVCIGLVVGGLLELVGDSISSLIGSPV